MKCPICNTNVGDYHIDSDGHGVLEEYGSCKKDHYEYKFAYGFSSTKIGDVEVLEAWNDKPFETKLKEKIINLALTIEKNKLLEESE